MKIRKVFAFILSQVLCLFSISTVSLSAFADDTVDFEKVYVSAVVNGKNQNLPAIQNKEGNVFFSGKTLSDVTVYNNNTSDYLFEHDNVDPKNKYRSIKIDKSIKKAHLLSFGLGEPIIQKSVELPDIIEFENEVYYPIAEMLPILNANAAVSDNKLYIEDVPYSLSNIMPEFNISNYMFNIYGTDTKILSGYSYLFNGLVDFELKKFVPVVGTRLNKIESYKDIFTSFLAEDEVYFEAINDEEHWSSPIVAYMYSDDSDRENAIVEAFDEMADISNKEHDELIKTFTTLDSWTTEYTTIDALGKGAKGIDLGLKAAAYIELYYDHVADHYEMLDAIYDFEATKKKNEKKIIAILEESYAAAEKIHTQFNDKKKKEIVGYITKQIGGLLIDEYKDVIIGELKEQYGLSQYSPLTYAKIGATISKLYFIATDSYVYNVSRKCENLPYYNKLMERGASKFWAYNNAKDNISKDNIEKARLSAIFTLLSSRSMYQALCDSDKALENSGAIYQKKIDTINEALKKLYLAKNCCLTDSGEYIDERIQELNSSMNQVTIIDENEEILYSDYDKAIFGTMIKALNSYNKVYRYKVCDADNDDQYEMAINVAFDNEDEFRGTNILAENIRTANLRYHLPASTGSAWSGFIYDTFNDKLLYSNQKASAGHAYSIYSCYENGEWNTISKYEREFTANDTEPQVKECFWNGINVTEDEFRNNENELNNCQWENSDEIFNVEVPHPIENVYLSFNNYLSREYHTTTLENAVINGNHKVYVIAVKNLFDDYLKDINYYSIDSGFIVDCPGLKNSLLSAYSTCFILDESEYGTRIRCQNFNEEIIIKEENGNIVSYRTEVPYKTSISSENGTLDNNILSFGKPMNGITKEEVKKLSDITLNLNARTRARSGLVLREGPSIDTKELDLIPYGTNLNVISLCDNFRYGSGDPMLLTEYNGKRGYVHSRYVLVDNEVDISTYTLEQKYAFGVLFYNQAEVLLFDFCHNGGIADCTRSEEFEDVFVKLLPKGITISQLTNDFYKYFSTDYTYGDAEGLRMDFSNYGYREKDGYLWVSTGFGDDVTLDYNEVAEMTNCSTEELDYTIINHIYPQYYDYYGYEQTWFSFSLRLEDGLWKVAVLR